jgi:hypothetical protein
VAKTAKSANVEEILGPVIRTSDFAQDRELSVAAGSARAWRRISPLAAAFEQGKLKGGDTRYTAENRFEAGVTFTRLYLTSQAPSKDSTQALNMSRGGTSSHSARADAIADSHRCLESVRRGVGGRDWSILVSVLGEGEKAATAVCRACGAGYENIIMVRFREALDSLIEALDSIHVRSRTLNAA